MEFRGEQLIMEHRFASLYSESQNVCGLLGSKIATVLKKIYYN